MCLYVWPTKLVTWPKWLFLGHHVEVRSIYGLSGLNAWSKCNTSKCRCGGSLLFQLSVCYDASSPHTVSSNKYIVLVLCGVYIYIYIYMYIYTNIHVPMFDPSCGFYNHLFSRTVPYCGVSGGGPQ